MSKEFLTWDQTTNQVQWDNNPYTWDDYAILIEVVELAGKFGASGGMNYPRAYQSLDNTKKKKLIKLIATVRGEEFKEEKYKKENLKVIAKDIEITVNEVLSIFIKKEE